MKIRNIAILLVALLLGAVAVYQAKGKDNHAKPEEAPKPHFAAPSFQLKTMDGRSLQVGGPRDKALVVNFWASWCEPCQMEASDLEALYKQYQDKVDFYGVNITYLDNVEDAAKFVKKYGITFPVLLDSKGSVADLYHAASYPTSFFIDKNGIIHSIILGLSTPEEWKRQLDKALAG